MERDFYPIVQIKEEQIMTTEDEVQIETASPSSIQMRDKNTPGNVEIIVKSMEMQVRAIELLGKELPLNSEFITTVEKLRQILSIHSNGQNLDLENENGHVDSNNYHESTRTCFQQNDISPEITDSGPANLLIDHQTETIKRLEQQLVIISGEKGNLESILREKDNLIEQQQNCIEILQDYLTRHQIQHNIEFTNSSVNANNTTDNILPSSTAIDVHEDTTNVSASYNSSNSAATPAMLSSQHSSTTFTDKTRGNRNKVDAVKHHIRKNSVESKLLFVQNRKEKLLLRKQLLVQQLRSLLAQDGA